MKKEINITIAITLVIIILISVYFFIHKSQIMNNKESFVSGQCPTTLVKKGNQILLYNPDMAKVPGVNPIVFKSLREYEKYVKWQRASGLRCPILHLERMFDTQGNAKYEIKNSFLLDQPVGPLNHDLPHIRKPPCVQDLLDANRENKPYNQNMFPSFDPYNQDVGKITNVDLTQNQPFDM